MNRNSSSSSCSCCWLSLIVSTLLLVLSSTSNIQLVSSESIESSSLPPIIKNSWILYHSLDGGNNYSRRGVVEWRTTTENETELNNNNDDDDDDDVTITIQNDNELLSSIDIQSMLSIGWYHLKLIPSSSSSTENNDDDNNAIVSTVSSCTLQRSNFRDEFQFVINRSSLVSNNIISMSYIPLVSPLAPKTCNNNDIEINNENENNKKSSFISKVSIIELDTPGMMLRDTLPTTKPPPGLTFLPRSSNSYNGQGSKPEEFGSDGKPKKPGQQEPIDSPQSFIKRYWYILLPLFLANFIGTEPPPPEGQQEGQPGGSGGQPGQQAPGGGGGSAGQQQRGQASAGGGGGGNRRSGGQRRGKRG